MSEVELEQEPETTVREFFAALELGALDEAFELVTPDVVWRNAGLPTLRGTTAMRRALAGIDRARMRFSAEFHHVVADGDVVLTDRTDHVGLGPVRADFWVCSTFELRDGRIALWHDRYAWGNVLRGGAAGVLRAVTTPWRRRPGR